MSIRAFSYGGGVQSTAALVLAARREIDFRLFVFANTGENAEHPKTLDYVTEVAGPYAERHGLQLHEVRKRRRGGAPDDLHDHLMRNPMYGIPVRLSTGAPAKRACTDDFKVDPIARWVKQRGATAQDKAVIGLGISQDEYQRMRSASKVPHFELAYPLVDRRLTRQDCLNVIAEAGLPEPVKSSCWFCPYHRPSVWTRMRREERGVFDRAAALERSINERRRARGRGPVWLTDFLRPLDQAIGDQMTLDEAMESCESGFCEVTF